MAEKPKEKKERAAPHVMDDLKAIGDVYRERFGGSPFQFAKVAQPAPAVAPSTCTLCKTEYDTKAGKSVKVCTNKCVGG